MAGIAARSRSSRSPRVSIRTPTWRHRCATAWPCSAARPGGLKYRPHRIPKNQNKEGMIMKSVVAAGRMVMTFSTSALAENIGVAMAYFDDNFLTVMRQEMGKEA